MGHNKKIIIVGAGLTGSLLALCLGRRGYDVSLFERRADPRTSPPVRGRSINLAISARGLRALEAVDLQSAVQPLLVPMYGRQIHRIDGRSDFQAYATDPTLHQNAISRQDLNELLLQACAQVPTIHIYFQHQLTAIDFEQNLLQVKDATGTMRGVAFEHVVGADGVSSVVREAMTLQGHVQSQVQIMDHGYKELTISQELGQSLKREALHLWPRHNFMLIALPNCDGSFTSTLFMANNAQAGQPHFEVFNDGALLHAFFQHYFADLIPRLPDLGQQLSVNPLGRLSTVQCAPWFYQDKVLLIGDAAHAIVPFLGQGMNAAFEDCTVLMRCLDKVCDWSMAMADFYQQRASDTRVLAQMALNNYAEMRDGVLDDNFQLRRQVAAELALAYPQDFISQYELVAFHHVPYRYAKACGDLQKNLLTRLVKYRRDGAKEPVHEAMLLKDYLQAINELH